jgi:hypothetical protein
MSEPLRVISINFQFQNQEVVQEKTLATERAFFDFDIVVIRPQRFTYPKGDYAVYQQLNALMDMKRIELDRLFAQGGVLVVILDVPHTYQAYVGGYTGGTLYSVNNYAFLRPEFARCLQSGSGEQISYSDTEEPFVQVLKNSTVAWTAYVASTPESPFNSLRFFASVGARAAVAGRMPRGEGHLILLPNLKRLEEALFFEACAEYRYKRRGTTPPDWVKHVYLPGLSLMESEIAKIDKEISNLQNGRQDAQQRLEKRSAYLKLLYEKGRTQLEPIVQVALNDLGFGAGPGEVIKGTNYEIDGRTTTGSSPGIVEVKGSKKQIALDEFSPFVVKILADHQATNVISKGILVGNGLCETAPEDRLGDAIFSPHVLDGAKRNSVALINSVELYWVCCTLLDGAALDRQAVREAILGGNGYVDLKPFCGKSPWRKAS